MDKALCCLGGHRTTDSMGDEEVTEVAAGGNDAAALLERELAALRSTDGVTSVVVYERQRRQSLNKSMVNVRLRGRAAPLSIHCCARLPTLLDAAYQMTEKIVDIIGEAAVAEGRRLRAEAEREAAAETARTVGGPAQQPPSSNFFAQSQRIQQLEAALIPSADERVRDADARWQAALVLVAEQHSALKEAQARVDQAQAVADRAQEPLLQAQEVAAALRGELEQLRRKRPRPSEEAAAHSRQQLGQKEAPPHFEKYKDYTLGTFRKLESEEMLRRSVVPVRLLHPAQRQPKEPRTGAAGALEHWRRGIIGAIQSWADGSLENVIILIKRLIEHFNILGDIKDWLVDAGVFDAALPALPNLRRHAATACTVH